MGLRDIIAKASKSAFNALGDIPNTITYTSVTGSPVRNIAAGTTTKPSSTFDVEQVVFARFNTKDVDKWPAILLTDMKIIILSANFQAADKDENSFTEDTFVDPDGKTWRVIAAKKDPVKATIIMQVRR